MNVPQLLQELSGSLTSLSPPASWPSPVHGCSCQSHQSVQSDLRFPLWRNVCVPVVKLHNGIHFPSIKRTHAKLTLEVLVFTLHGLQLIQSLLIGVLHLEELSAKRASLLLSSLKLSLTLLIFLLPLCQHLIKSNNTKYR